MGVTLTGITLPLVYRVSGGYPIVRCIEPDAGGDITHETNPDDRTDEDLVITIEVP